MKDEHYNNIYPYDHFSYRMTVYRNNHYMNYT